MNRPDIAIAIPTHMASKQLDVTIASVQRHTTGYTLHVVEDPSVNVAECREHMQNTLLADSRYVCFIDYDTEMIMDGWLDAMYEAMIERPDAGAVFSGEWWGTEPETQIDTGHGGAVEIGYGPAACMLIDRTRIPSGGRWDGHCGLRNGWLGGDFEEVDYCFRLRQHGLKLYRATASLFHHTGGRSTMMDFARTDRQRTTGIMAALLGYKYAKAPEDDDYFKGLKYVPADPDNDNRFAKGTTNGLRECYHDVIIKNGLSRVRSFQRLGLVD
jgi:hypothetical protein